MKEKHIMVEQEKKLEVEEGNSKATLVEVNILL